MRQKLKQERDWAYRGSEKDSFIRWTVGTDPKWVRGWARGYVVSCPRQREQQVPWPWGGSMVSKAEDHRWDLCGWVSVSWPGAVSSDVRSCRAWQAAEDASFGSAWDEGAVSRGMLSFDLEFGGNCRKRWEWRDRRPPGEERWEAVEVQVYFESRAGGFANSSDVGQDREPLRMEPPSQC